MQNFISYPYSLLLWLRTSYNQSNSAEVIASVKEHLLIL